VFKRSVLNSASEIEIDRHISVHVVRYVVRSDFAVLVTPVQSLQLQQHQPEHASYAKLDEMYRRQFTYSVESLYCPANSAASWTSAKKQPISSVAHPHSSRLFIYID